jgi:hypothetical protein
LLERQVVRLAAGAVAGAVGAHGLLREHVLLRLDGSLDVAGTEARARGQDDQVDRRVIDDLHVSVEATEDACIVHRHAVPVGLLQAIARRLGLGQVHIGHRDQAHVGIGRQAVVGGA